MAPANSSYGSVNPITHIEKNVNILTYVNIIDFLLKNMYVVHRVLVFSNLLNGPCSTLSPIDVI